MPNKLPRMSTCKQFRWAPFEHQVNICKIFQNLFIPIRLCGRKWILEFKIHVVEFNNSSISFVRSSRDNFDDLDLFPIGWFYAFHDFYMSFKMVVLDNKHYLSSWMVESRILFIKRMMVQYHNQIKNSSSVPFSLDIKIMWFKNCSKSIWIGGVVTLF